MGFAPGGPEAVLLHLTDEEQQVVTSLLYSVLEALAEPDDPEGAALRRRWFPDAYPDDAEAAEQFRLRAEGDLVQAKRSHAAACLSTLDVAADDGTRVLSLDDATAWALALNDIRLALGTHLGVGGQADGREQLYAADESELDDARGPALDLYDWLTWMQETLVRSLP